MPVDSDARRRSEGEFRMKEWCAHSSGERQSAEDRRALDKVSTDLERSAFASGLDQKTLSIESGEKEF